MLLVVYNNGGDLVLSVIVPVYNTKDYIDRCVQSIIMQSFKDLEIILIDDGSTDGCDKILDQYALKDKRIKVVHTTNHGQSSARNTGLDLSHGDYIAFVDSDDFLQPDAYTIMMKYIEDSDIDIVCAGVQEVDDKGVIEKKIVFSGKTYEYDVEETYNELCIQERFRFQVWNKIFRKSIIGQIRFPVNTKFEEVQFERRVLQNCSKTMYIDYPVYNYVLDRPGNTKSMFSNQKLHVFKEIDVFIDEMARKHFTFSRDKLVEMRLSFSISLGLEARKKKASSSQISFLNKQFDISRKMCQKYNCGNRRLYILYSISPHLVNVYRTLRSHTKSFIHKLCDCGQITNSIRRFR